MDPKDATAPAPPPAYIYLPYPPPPAPPTPAELRKRRVVAVVGVVWGLVLLVGGVWYALHGAKTAREQTTIAQAGTVVDRAAGQVLAAAGTSAVPAISGYHETSTCSITPVRSGVKYQRQVWLYTIPGSEATVLGRIAAGLPAGYHPDTYHAQSGTVSTLTADAGDYVGITGTVDRPGLVKVIVATGCRTVGHRPADDPTAAPTGTDRQVLDGAAGTLGMTVTGWAVHTLPCGVRTVEATGQVQHRADVLRNPQSVLDTADAHASRDGVALRIDGTTAVLTLTAGHCG